MLFAGVSVFAAGFRGDRRLDKHAGEHLLVSKRQPKDTAFLRRVLSVLSSV